LDYVKATGAKQCREGYNNFVPAISSGRHIHRFDIPGSTESNLRHAETPQLVGDILALHTTGMSYRQIRKNARHPLETDWTGRENQHHSAFDNLTQNLQLDLHFLQHCGLFSRHIAFVRLFRLSSFQ
jgi:hypothetical protein